MKATNETEEFRYRIEGDKVGCHDSISAGPTIFREMKRTGVLIFRITKIFRYLYCRPRPKPNGEKPNVAFIRDDIIRINIIKPYFFMCK